jgi:hypothetical protein
MTEQVKDFFEFRKPYQSIIRNLINNINICNRQYVQTSDEGYMVQRAKYVKEVEELKTFIKKEELRIEDDKRRCN